MAFGRTDLPLDQDSIGRFLPWIVAFMVFLSILAMAGVEVLGSLAARWDKGMSGTLTVQIPPAETSAETDRLVKAALALLRKADGVRSAEPIAEDRLVALLEPWLGPDVGSGDVPLPRLIDVAIDPGGGPDMAALDKKLSAIVAGAAIDDHRVWLERLISLLRAAQTVAVSILALLSAATVGTVIFTTRTGLAIHREVIEVLHLIGAQDSYIAGQFANRALMLALRGGLIGFSLAVPTLLGMGLVAKNLEAAVLPHLTLGPLQWVMLAVLPAIAALIAQVTARFTVMRTLAAML